MTMGVTEPPNGNGWAWVRFIVQHILLPLAIALVGYLFWTTNALSADVARKEDSLEAHREHSAIREQVLRNQLLRDQPPAWFREWADHLDERLQRMEDRER